MTDFLHRISGLSPKRLALPAAAIIGAGFAMVWYNRQLDPLGGVSTANREVRRYMYGEEGLAGLGLRIVQRRDEIGQAKSEEVIEIEGETFDKATPPFTVIRDIAGHLEVLSYPQAYSDLMSSVTAELRSAAKLIPEGQEEALRTYLGEAATAFENNDWSSADEAWAAMNAHNSNWYLRIAPDETYWEPCSLKAGFHFTLARVDPSSITWQEKLSPLRSEMVKVSMPAGRLMRSRHALMNCGLRTLRASGSTSSTVMLAN